MAEPDQPDRAGDRLISAAPSEPPVRVLLVSPRPDDERAGYIDHRVSALPVVEALTPLGEFAEWTILTPPTFKALTAELKRAYDADRPYHVVHFDGHGAYDRRHGLGGLCFEDPADWSKTEGRRTDLVHADQLAEALRDHNTPLIFLDACQSAAAKDEPTASVAGRLLAGGVASVAAMSHSVLVETARRFVGEFYQRLLAGDRVGQAMLHGQLELHGDSSRGWSAAGQLRLEDWFVPVLFQHRDDPQLLAAIPDEAMRALTANAERLKLGDTPPAPPHGFIGRSRLLLSAERRLTLPTENFKLKTENSFIVFRGEGGEGKTTLAAELARWLVLSRRFRRAAFVSLEHHVDARAVLHSIGRQLLPGFETEAAGNDDKARLIVQRELKRGPTILVLDNMESVLPTVTRSASEETLPSLAAEPEILANILNLAQTLAGTGSTRLVFTTREPLPEPFADHHVTIGRLERSEAIELVARVLGEEVGPAQMVAASETTDEHEIRDLVEAVGCHARALALLAGEIKQSGVSRATASITALMEQLEQKHPGQRERSLLASVELSLRRLPADMRAKLGPLAVFRGGGWNQVIGIALGLDIQKDEEIALAKQLVDVGLAEQLPYGYLQLDPALPAALARGQSAEQLAAARAGWLEATLALIGFLYEQWFKDPQMAATLTVLDLPNLLAALEWAAVGWTLSSVLPTAAIETPERTDEGVHPTVSPDEFVQAATQLEGLLQNLGRPRALARVAKLRAAAAQRLGDWSHARFNAESAAVDRLLESGRMQDALSAAQQLLLRCQTAGETASPEAPYDTAMAQWKLGRVLQMGGAAQAALEPLAEARRRFTTLANAGNASAARMASVCLAETGDCLADIGRLDEAAAAYEEKIKLAESRGDDRQVATGKGQLGTVRMLQGRHAEALAAFDDACRTFEQLGEPASVATAWHQIGRVHQEAGQYPAAEQAYQESLKIKVRMGNRQGEASTLDQLGILYSSMNRLEESVNFHQQAAGIRHELGDLAAEGRSRNNLAIRLLALHRHDEARRELLRAIECDQPYGHAAQPWKTFHILSDLERAVGDQAAAEAARQKARAAYLAYRRDGGQVAQGPGMQLCAAVLEAIQSGQIPAASAQLAELQSDPDLPAYLHALLPALQAILSGSRDPALADNPSLDFDDAAELLLLLERLSASA